MEKNIFEEVKFGNKFLTIGGEVLVFIGCFIGEDGTVWRKLIGEDEEEIRYYKMNGKRGLLEKADGPMNSDIVSKYQEPIDEKKLDKNSKKYLANNKDLFEKSNEPYRYEIKQAYKAGYHKRVEEE